MIDLYGIFKHEELGVWVPKKEVKIEREENIGFE
jgi:hypothetical protein